MLIPCLHKRIAIGADDRSDRAELPGRKPVVLAQSYGFEPEFADKFLALNVDMLRFIAVEAVEEESVWSCDTFHGSHDQFVLL
jgi:hypothetical protein